MIRSCCLLLALQLTVAAPLVAPARAVEPAGDQRQILLPTTIDQLWYRAAGKRREGYLIVSEEGLEFFARKRTVRIPLERIRFISTGTLGSDVDTDWILLSVGVTPPFDVVGVRDGAKWGFGRRTDEIYRTLRSALRQLQAAQFRVPEGHRAYEDPGRGCALAIPDDWSTYVESLVVVGTRSPGGTTLFSKEPIRIVETGEDEEVRATDDLELLDAILAGESPGFFLERSEAGRGMDCTGFSTKARERLLDRAGADIVFGEGYEVVDPPSASAGRIAECDALLIRGRSRRPDGAELVLELYAVTRGDRLYLFGLRALADRLEEFRLPFERSLSTVKFATERR